MLYLIIEEKYRSYPWCQRCLAGIWEEARKKRTSVLEIENINQIPEGGEPSAILLLGASEKWVHRQVQSAHSAGIHPIALSNRLSAPKGYPISSVAMDIHDSMRTAIDYLHSLGRHRLALYGCNPSAMSDPWREDVFRTIVGPSASVFYNRESLEQTFAEFFPEQSRFDGVICTNDYAALSLIRHLQEAGISVPEQLCVIGYGDLFLSRLTQPSVTSISDDYEHFGRAALSIYNLVVKEKTISTVSILLHSRLQIRATTGNQPYHPALSSSEELPAVQNPFFADEEITEMARLETLLQHCDATDLEIIRHLMGKQGYAAIADACFISETAAKYRIRKMEAICGVESRTALTEFLKNYF